MCVRYTVTIFFIDINYWLVNFPGNLWSSALCAFVCDHKNVISVQQVELFHYCWWKQRCSPLFLPELLTVSHGLHQDVAWLSWRWFLWTLLVQQVHHFVVLFCFVQVYEASLIFHKTSHGPAHLHRCARLCHQVGYYCTETISCLLDLNDLNLRAKWQKLSQTELQNKWWISESFILT